MMKQTVLDPHFANSIDIGHGMRVAVVLVTVSLAEAWLAKNHPENRTFKPFAISGIVKDIVAGKWDFTHQAICFDACGILIDGQHRLFAIVEAGVPCKLLVVWSQHAKISHAIDRGTSRAIFELMKSKRKAVAVYTGLESLMCGYDFSQKTKMTVALATDVEQKFGAEFSELYHSVPLADKAQAGVLSACVWAFPLHKEGVIEFLRGYVSGEMIKKGDASFCLRAWASRGYSPKTWDYVLATCIALRHHLTGYPIRVIYVTDLGYRALTTQRRVQRLPWTPSNEDVPTASLKPSARSSGRGIE